MQKEQMCVSHIYIYIHLSLSIYLYISVYIYTHTFTSPNTVLLDDASHLAFDIHTHTSATGRAPSEGRSSAQLTRRFMAEGRSMGRLQDGAGA